MSCLFCNHPSFHSGLFAQLNGYSHYDQINDQINDAISDLGLELMRFIQKKPGAKVPSMLLELNKSYQNLTADKIRNVIKREIKNYIELRGSKKTGGYYIKKNN